MSLWTHEDGGSGFAALGPAALDLTGEDVASCQLHLPRLQICCLDHGTACL